MTTEKKAASLNQMAKLKLGDVTRRDMPYIPPSLLVIEEGFNIRGACLSQEEYWAQEHIIEYVEAIAQSYIDGNYVPPMVVKFDKDAQKAVIREGHHRYKALMIALEKGAPIERVPVVEYSGDELSQIVLMLQSANTLEQSAVDKAEGIHRLYAYGLTEEEIATKIKKSVPHVKDMLRVYNLPLEIKRKIQQKKISYASALAEEREANPKRAKSVTPPKKVVRDFVDVLAQYRDAPVVDGKVTIEIPAELLEQYIANLPSESASQEVNEDQNVLELE